VHGFEKRQHAPEIESGEFKSQVDGLKCIF